MKIPDPMMVPTMIPTPFIRVIFLFNSTFSPATLSTSSPMTTVRVTHTHTHTNSGFISKHLDFRKTIHVIAIYTCRRTVTSSSTLNVMFLGGLRKIWGCFLRETRARPLHSQHHVLCQTRAFPSLQKHRCANGSPTALFIKCLRSLLYIYIV